MICLRSWFFLVAAMGVLASASNARSQVTAFQQTNLVSSVAGQAPVIDPNLRNPWGIALSSGSPFWIANQVSANATLYNGAGQPFPVGNPLIVSVPSTGNPSGPTGVVFNSTTDFPIFNTTGSAATFIFANRNGNIQSWNGSLGTTTVNNVLGTGASYTGLTIGNNGTANFLYAANFANARIDVFNANFGGTSLGGNFTDPGIPNGFSPHNIQTLGGTVFVAYKNAASGGGIVSAFSTNGNFLRRVTTNSAGGHLDAPWGLAIAPAGFGPFGGALLVGNEGDGHISAFDVLSGSFLGQISNALNQPIANPGLWGLTFGNGVNGGSPSTLYFTAGIQGETQGLFGSISPVPEPSAMILVGLAAVMGVRRARKPAAPRPGLLDALISTFWTESTEFTPPDPTVSGLVGMEPGKIAGTCCKLLQLHTFPA
jgi:uncharacterized protein (TIGR03118 family)